ncbi:MAG: LysE family translocator [Rhodoferax sp.]
MISLSTLLVFLLAVFTLFLSPGPNMAFVLSHGMAYGPRGGFAAALGIGLADALLAVLTAVGITAVVAAWPPAFDLLRLSGALYLVWLAVKALRTPVSALARPKTEASLSGIVVKAMFNSLLNPKALLFFMVFLPQFVDQTRGDIAWQLLELGLILSLAAVVFNTALGYFSGWIGQYLQRNPRFARKQSWFMAAVLCALAVRLVCMDRPAPT